MPFREFAGFVPEGLRESSPAFQRGVGRANARESRRDESTQHPLPAVFSAVPAGLAPPVTARPALKRWAITGRPCGTSAPLRHREFPKGIKETLNKGQLSVFAT